MHVFVNGCPLDQRVTDGLSLSDLEDVTDLLIDQVRTFTALVHAVAQRSRAFREAKLLYPRGVIS